MNVKVACDKVGEVKVFESNFWEDAVGVVRALVGINV